MSLTRRLVLSFAVILLFGLLSIITHVWGNDVRWEKFSNLQMVMRDQNAVREFGQSLDVMHKKMRVIQTLHQAVDESPISVDEAREQLISVRGMRTRNNLLQERLRLSLGRDDLAGVDRLLQHWLQYLERLVGVETDIQPQTDGAAPDYAAVMQSLIERELALVRRAAEINAEGLPGTVIALAGEALGRPVRWVSAGPSPAGSWSCCAGRPCRWCRARAARGGRGWTVHPADAGALGGQRHRSQLAQGQR